MTGLVAISASYGAGGSEVGPALATRMGVPFLDRAIPLAVAEQLHLPVEEADADFEHGGRSFLERVLRGFIGTDAGVPTPVPADALGGDQFREATEQALRDCSADGRAVILGRGAVLVLRDDPRALRVRLDGPRARRVEQAMRLGGVDHDTAERSLRQLDRVHEDYARHFYGATLQDPSLYHLSLDSTALTLETCIDVIAAAAGALRIAAPPTA